jgi:peptidoglycan/xylan/chitin deacetylase (PgdA/CDA1 family)
MKVSTVLMYHALSDEGRLAGDADPHYTLTRERFGEQLQMMRALGLGLCSVKDVVQGNPDLHETPHVALTFDDGHASNAAATEDITRNGGRADFFVNPSTIGRANHLSWSELRQMASSGMSIQSHGYTHRYLDALSRPEVESELIDSKKEIEHRLGQPVLLFAPAGGRMPKHFMELARSAGYTAVCASQPGGWTHGGNRAIPRFAVLASTTDVQLRRWVTGARLEMLLQQARYRMLRAMRHLLGNRTYEQIRTALLGQTRDQAPITAGAANGATENRPDSARPIPVEPPRKDSVK